MASFEGNDGVLYLRYRNHFRTTQDEIVDLVISLSCQTLRSKKSVPKLVRLRVLYKLGKLLGVILIDDQSSKCQAPGVNNDLRFTHECDKNYYF